MSDLPSGPPPNAIPVIPYKPPPKPKNPTWWEWAILFFIAGVYGWMLFSIL